MGQLVSHNELRSLRLARLKDELLRITKAIGKQPLFEGRRHPLYIEFGRVLYEAATRDFKPREIPKQLRPCPWLYVLAELSRLYPEIQWGEPALAEYVQCYLASLSDPQPMRPAAPQLDFTDAAPNEGA